MVVFRENKKASRSFTNPGNKNKNLNKTKGISNRKKLSSITIENIVSEITNIISYLIVQPYFLAIFIGVSILILSHTSQGKNSALIHAMQYLHKFTVLKPIVKYLAEAERILIGGLIFIPAVFTLKPSIRIVGTMISVLWIIYSEDVGIITYIAQSSLLIIFNMTKNKNLKICVVILLPMVYYLSRGKYEILNVHYNYQIINKTKT